MTAETTRHRYPVRTVVFEYVQSAVGMAFTFGPLAATTPLPAVTGVLAALGALFFIFGVRTVIRHNTVVELSDEGVVARGLKPATVRWDELSRLKLSYFSTRRDRTGGWMQVRLKGAGRTLRVDSTMEGFDRLVARSAEAARARNLELEPTTVQNLAWLGLFAKDDTARGSGRYRA